MSKAQDQKVEILQTHYSKWTQINDTRRTRKNGWDDVISAYMGKLPPNWPYQSVVTDPVIRTTIIEKNSRLLNSKLQGRLIPREGGDLIKARINNALLDFQWDNAQEGGTMIEKVASCDQGTRLFGASFGLVYWDTKKDSNEFKPWDIRDIGFDPGANHIRNAKWVQLREWSTVDTLERRGFDVKKLKAMIKRGEITSDRRQNAYNPQELSNKSIEDEQGTDIAFVTVEVVTEYTPKTCVAFLPKYNLIIKDAKNPYKHGKIPLAMLRYYPLGTDIIGESEVEGVIPLSRAINAVLCGTIDELNLATRPPVIAMSGQYRKESIVYGPGAIWEASNPDALRELQMGANAVQAFNTLYPALKAAYNTAMGDQSLGISNVSGAQEDKTATEVKALVSQQSNRDQNNQMYLAEFLKDIMMMWLSNNKQYLFDDPTKKFRILKIVGKQNIQALQAMRLDELDIPDYAINQIADTVMQNPEMVSEQDMMSVVDDVAMPTNSVIINPQEEDPENYQIKNKLEVSDTGEEAELYYTADDLADEQVLDYIPDVKSMAAGAGAMQQEGRQKAVELVLNPQVGQMLMSQGESLKIKELLVTLLEDIGYKDAEGLFQSNQMTPQVANPMGAMLPMGNGQQLPLEGGPANIGPGQANSFPPGVAPVQEPVTA